MSYIKAFIERRKRADADKKLDAYILRIRKYKSMNLLDCLLKFEEVLIKQNKNFPWSASKDMQGLYMHLSRSERMRVVADGLIYKQGVFKNVKN
jgi:hypothetical protein